MNPSERITTPPEDVRIRADIVAFAYDTPNGEKVITLMCCEDEALDAAHDLGLRVLGKVAHAVLEAI